MAAPDLNGPAWRFALEVYGKPDVAPACLRLQDEGGLDVVLLLAVGYAARRGLHLDDADLDRLDTHIAAWRHRIVRPLREVRRALKQAGLATLDAPMLALRRTIKGAELEAERLQLAALAGELPEVPPGIAAIAVFPALQAVFERAGAAAALLPLLAAVATALEETPV